MPEFLPYAPGVRDDVVHQVQGEEVGHCLFTLPRRFLGLRLSSLLLVSAISLRARGNPGARSGSSWDRRPEDDWKGYGMNAQVPDDSKPDRHARARNEEEPGSHSGAESQPRDRIVPGTASAKEGYQTYGDGEAGTGSGEPLAGVGTPAGSAEEGYEPGRSAGPGPRITREHVRALLGAPVEAPAPHVVIEGRAEVVPSAELSKDRYADAIEVASAKDLTDSLGGGTPSEQD